MRIRSYYGSRSIPEALDKYRTDGFALLPPVFAHEEMDALADRVERYRVDDRLRYDRSESHVNIAFWTATVDPALDALRSAHPLLSVVSEVLGTDDIKQHIQHIFFRDPGSPDSFRWHRDEIFRGQELSDPRRTYVALAIYLDDITELSQGAVVYVPKSQTWGAIDHLETSDSIRGRTGGDWDFGDQFEECEVMLPRRGMVGLWNAGTIHGSQPNSTSRNRRYILHGYARADATSDPSYVWAWRGGVPQRLPSGGSAA